MNFLIAAIVKKVMMILAETVIEEVFRHQPIQLSTNVLTHLVLLLTIKQRLNSQHVRELADGFMVQAQMSSKTLNTSWRLSLLYQDLNFNGHLNSSSQLLFSSKTWKAVQLFTIKSTDH